jgi:hypothetical protein
MANPIIDEISMFWYLYQAVKTSDWLFNFSDKVLYGSISRLLWSLFKIMVKYSLSVKFSSSFAFVEEMKGIKLTYM